MGPQLQERALVDEGLDHRPHVIDPQAVLRDRPAQFALVALDPGRRRTLEIGQGLLGQSRGVGLVLGQYVDHAVGGLDVHRPDLLGGEHPKAAALDHRRPAHADVGALGADENFTNTGEGGVAREAAARHHGNLGHPPGQLGEGLEAGRGQAGGCHAIGVAGPAAAAFGEPHHRQLLLLDDLQQAVGLHVVHVALGAGQDGEIVGQGGAARLLGTEQGAIDRADAADQAVGGADLQQMFGRVAAALGGHGEGAVFEEGARIDQVVDVLPGGALVAGPAAGHGLGPRLVQGGQPAGVDLGQVGPDEIEVDFLFDRVANVFHRLGNDEQQRLVLEHHRSAHRGDAGDPAAFEGGDHMLHLHRFEDRQGLAGPDQLALDHRDRPDRGLQRRPHGLGAVNRLLGGGQGRAGGALAEQAAGQVGSGGDQFGGVGLDKGGGGLAGYHFLAGQQGAQHADCGVRPGDAEFRQGPGGPGGGLVKGGALDDHLGQQGVVVGVGDIAGVAIAIDPHARTGRGLVGGQAAAGRLGVAVGGQGFQIDPGLDGETARGGRGAQADAGQGVAGGQADLGLHQIDAGHRLGDGVLDLQPGVGLDEVEVLGSRLEQELDGAQGAVADGGGDVDGGLEQAGAQGFAQARGRGDLQDLLVPPLQRAVALAYGQNAGAVAGHLHLDVAGGLQQAFGVDGADAEGGLGLAAGGGEGGGDLLAAAHHPHAPAAAAGDGLDHHRRPGGELVEEGGQLRFVDGPLRAGNHGNPGADGQQPGPGLVAEGVEGFGGRADEQQSGLGAGPGEGGALGQEAVAGVDGVAAAGAGGGDHPGNVEIGLGAGHAQRQGPVGRLDVQAGLIVGGIDRRGSQLQIGRRPGDADGDFPAVGDQDVGDGHGGP